MIHIVELSIAAIIAGFVSVLGLIISKEQKTSEFRQTWIDALRSDSASLIARASALKVIYSAGGSVWGTHNEMAVDAKDEIRAVNQHAATIRLRLNPDEPTSSEIIAQVEKMESLLISGNIPSDEQMNSVVMDLVRVSQVALKSEWKRVKRGEPIFRVCKGLALATIIAGLVALVAHAFGH